MIGTTVSHYKITAKLGEGGMGEVYLAEDTRLDREVAIKVLPEALSQDPERLARFEREAKAIAALNHPNIVTIHGIEEAEGRRFLIMEKVDGKSLDQRLPRNGFALDELLEISIPMADALAATHDQGIIHRDLKPANVMVTDTGLVKLLDFGLAKLTEATTKKAPVAGNEDDTETALLTREGTVIGTAPYMSPEQLRGQEIDTRSDVFSLGIVLYEMATGRRPFQGKTPIDLASSILQNQPPPLVEIRDELPRQLGRIVGSCLEKKPDARFQSARDVHNQLKALQRETTAAQQPVSLSDTAVRGASPRVWLAVAVAAVAIGAGALFIARSQPTGNLPTPATDVADLKLKDYESSAETLLENFGDPEALRMSIEAWERVTALEPDYAPALAGMATARTLIAWNSMPDPDLLDQAEQEAEAAIQLDPSLASPYSALSFIYSMRGLFEAAQEVSRRSLELGPEDPWVLQARARFLIDMYGRFEEAEDLATRAAELDPKFFPAFFQLGWAQMELQRFEEAEVAFRRAIELRPDFPAGYLGMGLVLDLMGSHQEAIESFEICLELDPDSTQCLLFGGLAHDNLGRYDEALESFRRVSRHNPDHPLTSYALLYEAVELEHLGRVDEQAVALEAAERVFKANPKMWFNLKGLAGVAAQRKDPEAALAWLRQAVEAGMKSVNQIRNDPALQPLRGDPRFVEILDSLQPG